MPAKPKTGGAGLGLSERVRILVRPKRDGTPVHGSEELVAKEKDAAAKKLAKKTPKRETKDMPAGIDYKMAGRRFIRTWAGADFYGGKIGDLIGSDDDPPRPGAPSGSHYTSYTNDELESIYGATRWSSSTHSGEFAVRLMMDGDAIITYDAENASAPDEHVIFLDGLTEGGMRDLLQTIDVGTVRADEVAEWDDDERAEYLEEHGYADAQEHLIDYWISGGIYIGVDKHGDMEIGPAVNGEPGEGGAAFTSDEANDLRDTLDNAWTAQLDGTGLTEDEDEEDEEEPPVSVVYSNEATYLSIHADDESLEFNPAETRAMVALWKTWEPVDLPPAGDTIQVTIGRWVVDLDSDAEVSMYREDNNTGSTISWDDWAMGMQSFESVLEQKGPSWQ